MTTASSTYALRLSDDELERYGRMAARARRGDRAVDVGRARPRCPGRGRRLRARGDAGHARGDRRAHGQVVGVDADPAAVAAARAALATARLGGAVAPGTVRLGRAGEHRAGTRLGRHGRAAARPRPQRPGRAAIVDHLATLVRPGGHVYLVDVDMTTFTVASGPPVTLELHARYVRWNELQGNDPRIGLRLPDLARAAGLDVVEYRGWTAGEPAPRGTRGPAWAARVELVRAGLADPGDIARWDAAFAALDAAPERPRPT